MAADWRLNRLLVLPFYERWAAKARILRGQPLWGGSVFALTNTATGPDPGWQAKEPEPPPDALGLAFKLLGLEKGASEADVKAAFKRLAFEHHPDRGGDGAKFAEVASAKDRVLAFIKDGTLL